MARSTATPRRLIILDSPFQNGALDGDASAAAVCPFLRARPALLLKAYGNLDP
ncbi:hypothetical protein WME94_19670 [Sorangium sp. So ce429]